MPFKDETPMNRKTPYRTGIGIYYNTEQLPITKPQHLSLIIFINA